jgi:hypothetical protein
MLQRPVRHLYYLLPVFDCLSAVRDPGTAGAQVLKLQKAKERGTAK